MVDMEVIRRHYPGRVELLERLDTAEALLEDVMAARDAQLSVKNRVKAAEPKRVRIYVDHCKTPGERRVVGEVRVEARCLDGDLRFGQLFEKVEVFWDKKTNKWLTPLTYVPAGTVDGLAVRRELGLRNAKACPVRILLYRRFSPALQKVTNITTCASRTDILRAISAYADDQDLRDLRDLRMIYCDELLRAAFNVDTFTFSQLDGLLSPLLKPPDPVLIDYTLPAGDGSDHAPKIVDVDVYVDDEAAEARPADSSAAAAKTSPPKQPDHPYFLRAAYAAIVKKRKRCDKDFYDHLLDGFGADDAPHASLKRALLDDAEPIVPLQPPPPAQQHVQPAPTPQQPPTPQQQQQQQPMPSVRPKLSPKPQMYPPSVYAKPPLPPPPVHRAAALPPPRLPLTGRPPLPPRGSPLPPNILPQQHMRNQLLPGPRPSQLPPVAPPQHHQPPSPPPPPPS